MKRACWYAHTIYNGVQLTSFLGDEILIDAVAYLDISHQKVSVFLVVHQDGTVEIKFIVFGPIAFVVFIVFLEKKSERSIVSSCMC